MLLDSIASILKLTQNLRRHILSEAGEQFSVPRKIHSQLREARDVATILRLRGDFTLRYLPWITNTIRASSSMNTASTPLSRGRRKEQ